MAARAQAPVRRPEPAGHAAHRGRRAPGGGTSGAGPLGHAGSILWGISKFETLDGAGGLAVSGRWHTAGRPVVYCAEHPALAMLEVLVHLEVGAVPRALHWLRIAAPDRAETYAGPGQDLSDARATRAFGDRWLQEARSCLLRVPSAIAPESFNVLLNPAHPDSSGALISAA